MSDSTLRGGAELQAFLNQLPAKIERNIMRGALRKGGNVVKKEAQKNLVQNGSVVSGAIKKGLKVSTKARGSTVTASVKVTGKHSYIAHWLEYGVAPHGVKKGAKRKSGKLQENLHPGFDALPFMRPALDTRQSEIINEISRYVKSRLTKQGIDTPDVDLELVE